MNPQQLLHDCDQAIADLLPALPRPEQKALSMLVTGIVRAERVTLARACAATPGPARDRSKQRRGQRLLANPRLDVRAAQAALLPRALAHRSGRIDLLLDATTTGASAHDAGTTTLLLGVAEHGRMVPLVWRSWGGQQPDQDWTGTIPQVLATVAAACPPAVQPVLYADRGLGNAGLARQAQAHGWHYLLRVTKTTRALLPDGRVCPLGDLAPRPGSVARISGARVGAPRRKVGSAWVSDWAHALVTNLVAVWPADTDEAWLLLTDLPATRGRCREYRRRTWEEEGVRDTKSQGWHWQRSRVRQPERVDRLLLAITLATLWMLALGQRVLRSGQRRWLDDASRRTLSRFQLGLRWLKRRLTNGEPVRCCLYFWADRSAPIKLS